MDVKQEATSCNSDSVTLLHQQRPVAATGGGGECIPWVKGDLLYLLLDLAVCYNVYCNDVVFETFQCWSSLVIFLIQKARIIFKRVT